MNFHPTTASRIREIDSAYTVEHRATMHYSNTNRAVRVDNAVVVVKNVKEMIGVATCEGLISTIRT